MCVWTKKRGSMNAVVLMEFYSKNPSQARGERWVCLPTVVSSCTLAGDPHHPISNNEPLSLRRPARGCMRHLTTAATSTAAALFGARRLWRTCVLPASSF